MDTRQNRLIIFSILLLTQTSLDAQLHSTKIELPEDSVPVTIEDLVPTKHSFLNKFLDYFNDANKEKKNKKFDFSVIGGPHYSSDTKFGIGLVAAGLYRTNHNDTILPPSNVSLYGDTPWGLMATLGSSYSMRGYYEGRYRDKGAMDAQIELRQHGFTPKHILPNYGLGYRWEFKKRVNVRLDLGFGKRQT